MAYVRHALFAFGGSLGNSETWSTTLRLHSQEFEAATPDQRAHFCSLLSDELVLPIQQFMSGNAALSRLAKAKWLKINPINPDGTYESSVTYGRMADSNSDWGAGTGAPTPFQNAIVASLGTNVARGLASHGRMYFPSGFGGVDDRGQISEAQATQLGNYVASFLTNIGRLTALTEPSIPHVFPSVVSPGRGGAKSPTPGPWRHVDHIRVGRVPDTQRRRRRQLFEEYVSVQYPVPAS
jgi:hypothetical protein